MKNTVSFSRKTETNSLLPSSEITYAVGGQSPLYTFFWLRPYYGQAVSLVLCDNEEKDDPSRDSNHVSSAIRADVLAS